jgi:serine/threonine protein kinase
MLNNEYELKLADFGFSISLAGRDGSGDLYTHKGTPGFQAPEILLEKPYKGVHADMFAAGVNLFIFLRNGLLSEKQRHQTDGIRISLQNNIMSSGKCIARDQLNTVRVLKIC